MDFSNTTKQTYAALLKKTDKDTDRIGKFLDKMTQVEQKFQTPEKKQEWHKMSEELNIYHSRYKEARDDENEHLMESALRQQYLDANPDEELTTKQQAYDEWRVEKDKKLKETGTYDDEFRFKGEKLYADMTLREIELKNEVNAKSMFDRRDPAIHAAASGIVNTVIGMADLVTMGMFDGLQDTMKEIGMPDLTVDENGDIVEDSKLQKTAISGAEILGSLLLPIGEAKAATSVSKATTKSLGTRLALAASAGTVNYGSALALSVADDNPEANAGYAGTMAASLGFGGKVGFMLFGGSTGVLVGDKISDNPELGLGAGVALAATAIATKGAVSKMFPGVKTLTNDAQKLFAMSNEEIANVKLNAVKLFNIDDVSKVTNEQLLVSIFNSNPNAKSMMYKAILNDETTKATVNKAQQAISDSLKNLVGPENKDLAIRHLDDAYEAHKALKSELSDMVSGTQVDLKISDEATDFSYGWTLDSTEAKLMSKLENEEQLSASEMLDVRDTISKHMRVGSNSTLDKKLAMKAETVLAKIDNQVLKNFDEEQQAMYFLNNRTQAQLRTLRLKGTGLADFLNTRLPLDKRYRALQNVMSSEQQYSNLLKVFEGEEDMMKSFEDVVLNKLFDKASKEGVLDFVKLSGEINKLPWKDIKLEDPTYSFGAGEVIESRGGAIADVVDLFAKNYKNTRFMSGLAEEAEHVGVRSSPMNMAQVTVLTKVYNTVAKLWSAESRLVTSLPKYLRNQQIPANVSIQDNVAIFDLMKTLHPDITLANSLSSVAPSLSHTNVHVPDVVDGTSSHEMNYILPAADRAKLRGLPRSTPQKVNVGSANDSFHIPNRTSDSTSSGWNVIQTTSKEGAHKEAMFIVKDTDTQFKVLSKDLFEKGTATTMSLADVMDTKLFKVYPELKDIRVRFSHEEAGTTGISGNFINIDYNDLANVDFVYETIAARLAHVENLASLGAEPAQKILDKVRKAYNLPKTLDGRMRLLLNHELQHYITKRAFPRLRPISHADNVARIHDEHMEERVSEVTRIAQGQDVKSMRLQTAIDSEDAMRGSGGIVY